MRLLVLRESRNSRVHEIARKKLYLEAKKIVHYFYMNINNKQISSLGSAVTYQEYWNSEKKQIFT